MFLLDLTGGFLMKAINVKLLLIFPFAGKESPAGFGFAVCSCRYFQSLEKHNLEIYA